MCVVVISWMMLLSIFSSCQYSQYNHAMPCNTSRISLPSVNRLIFNSPNQVIPVNSSSAFQLPSNDGCL